jgi:hypothetical protein
MSVKDRINAMFPGDGNKAIRAKIYRTPGIMAGEPTDEQIRQAVGEGGEGESDTEPPQSAPALVKAVPDQVAELLAKVPTIVVKTAQDYEQAARWFASLKAMAKVVEDRRGELKAPHLAEGKRIDAEAKVMQELLAKVLDPIAKQMAGFKAREAEELRRQEEERQAAIAAEQARLAAEAERAQAAVAVVETQAEEDPFLAAILEDQISETRQQAGIAAVALAIGVDEAALPEVPKAVTAAGVRAVSRWKWRITDDGLVPRAMCSPDERKLNEFVRACKANGQPIEAHAHAYEGIEIYEELSIEGGR